MRLPLPLALLACRLDSTDPDALPATCETAPAVAVERFAASPGPLPTQVVLDLELSAPAAVAARCVSDLDPEEVFLVESAEPADRHALRLSGLVPDTTWTCEAVPTCPGGPVATTTTTTGRPPPALRPLTVEVDPELGASGAWTLAPFSRTPYGDTWLVVWGPDGTARWWSPLPEGVGRWVEARWHPEEGAIVWGGGMDPEGRVRILDLWDGERFAFAPKRWEELQFHHDGKRVADGRLMTLERRRNDAGDDTWDGFGIRVIDPATGEVHLDYDSQRAVDAGDLPPPATSDDEDPWHANWMDLARTADGPELYVSLCFDQSLMAIDPGTGDTRWVLGPGRGWTVLDADGAPLGEDALPQCQHGVEVVGEREFLLYDNGWGRGESSAAAWRVDPDGRTATRTWTWTEPGWWQEYLGDIDDLGGGRVLITVASDWDVAELVEVDRPTGRVASRMTFADGGYTYRSDRYPGCDLFDAVRACPELAARHEALRPLFEP